MNNYKKITIYILILFMAIGAVFVYNQEISLAVEEDSASGEIAFVDIQEVFSVHPDKLAAEEELNLAAQELQTELEEEARDLSKEEQEEMLREYQAELSEKEQQLIQDILADIEESIRQVAEEKEVRMVLDKKNVIYGGYDLTNEVIEYIESREN